MKGIRTSNTLKLSSSKGKYSESPNLKSVFSPSFFRAISSISGERSTPAI